MPLQFSLTDGTPLSTTPGFPDNYTGTRLKGTAVSHLVHSFGHIVLQEFTTPQISMSKILVHWKKPVRIKCQYEHVSPVLFCRAMDNNSMCEVVKGSGDVYLEKEQFAALTGKRWTGLIISEKAGDHDFTNLTWNADFLQTALGDDDYLNKVSRHFQYGLAERLNTTGRDVSYQMKTLTESLNKVDFDDRLGTVRFDDVMVKYLKLILRELKDCESVKKKMKEVDWHAVNKAKKLIDYNLETQYTTPELSLKVGVNEYKLKKLFPKVAGYSVEEYRRYKLLSKAARKIVQNPDASIKSFSEEAGYTSVSTFTRAFNKMGCTPAELREDTWDVKRLENYSIPQNESDD